MNEAIARKRSGAPKYVPVVGSIVERNVLDIVLYAAKHVANPTPESFADLEKAVNRMASRSKRNNRTRWQSGAKETEA